MTWWRGAARARTMLNAGWRRICPDAGRSVMSDKKCHLRELNPESWTV
jgi:hypothetical protein